MDLLNVRYLRSAFCIYYVVCSRRHGSQITFPGALLTFVNVVSLETISTKHKLLGKIKKILENLFYYYIDRLPRNRLYIGFDDKKDQEVNPNL